MPHLTRSGLTLSLVLAAGLLLSGCDQHGKPRQSTEVAAVGLHAAALASDGSLAVVGSINHGGSLWRLRDQERLYDWNHKQGEFSTLTTMDVSPDNRWVMTADPHTMVLWSPTDGQASRYWTAPGQVLSLALARNGDFALLAMDDFSAVIFDVKRGGIKRTFNHTDQVRSADMSDDGRLALTGADDYTAILWDVNSGKALHTIRHDDAVVLVALSPDGRLALTVGQYDRAIVWDTASGREIGTVPLKAGRLKRGQRFTAARFSADGKQLLTGLPDQLVQLWDTATMAELDSWMLPKRKLWKPTGTAVLALSFGTEPNRFTAVGSDGFIHQLQRAP
jgi:WD40 repeat protein